MEYNGKSKVVLIAPASYVAVCFKGDSDMTKNGDERWTLHYKLLAVMEAKDEDENEAADCVGSFISDNLISTKKLAYKWDMLLPIMFPEIKEKGEAANVHAEDCIGCVSVIMVGKANQDPKWGPTIINRIYRWSPFDGDVTQFADEIKKVLPEADVPTQEKAPAGDDEFTGQF